MEALPESHFNIQLLTTATVLSILSVHSSLIEKPIFKWLNKKSGKEKELLSQKNALKRDQSSISMADEFAKYSKIQRRINSIDEKLMEMKSNKHTNSIVVQLGFTYGVKLVLVLVLIILGLYYRYTPVIYLGDQVNLTPFSYLICYPNDVNYVSFYFWVMCTATVARLLQ